MVDCLEYAVKKENELPKIIEIIFNKITNNQNFTSFNRKMRTATEILKDYGLS